MMSLNSTRSRRVTDGTTSGKRGRPESVVRQYWEDIGVPNLGPKCIFCDHRSVTRLFRAPPATRHTLICKNAPEDVKAQLRRVTNNKYSRRPPLSTDASAQAAAAAVAASKSLPHTQQQQQQQQHGQPHHQQHRTQHPHQQQHHQQAQPIQHHQPQPQPHHQQQGHPHHHQPQHHQPHQPQLQQQPPVSQQPQQQFTFKHTTQPPADAHNHDPTSIPNHASPRHISANVVTSMNGNSPAAMNSSVDPGVVPATVRSVILKDHRSVAATPRSIGIAPSHVVASAALSPATTDILYAGGSSQRLLPHPTDDLTSPNGAGSLERANAALAAAVVEALFPPGSGRKKEGQVPTPAEFRVALQEVKETARNKAKRQRNEARAESTRLQNAISLLVTSKSIGGGNERPVDAVESDDSEDDIGAHVGNHMPTARRNDWSNGYDRVHKMER